MAESAFMLRQRKLLEETKKNKGVPPLKSLYGTPTPTANTENTLQNITGPGGQEFYDATNAVKNAYSEGGTASAIGMGLRKTPGVLAATVRDTLTPAPLRNLAGNIAGETKEVAQVALTGDVVPTPNTNTSFKRTPFEDRAANNLLYAEDKPEQLGAPLIREKQNDLRDAELGKMTSSAVANKNGGTTRTFNIGGNILSYNTEDAPEGSFTAGGTDRSMRNLQQSDAAAYEHKFRNMGTNQRVAEPTVSEEQLKQYDQREGLKSGRYQKPRNPMLGMNSKERIAYRKTLADLQANTLNNTTQAKAAAETAAIAKERNDILRAQGLASIKPPASQVLTDVDMLNTKTQRIMNQRPDGTWVNGMGNEQSAINQLPENHPAVSFLRKNPKQAMKFREKYGYLPKWAMNK